jgi:predicted dehydrogenase
LAIYGGVRELIQSGALGAVRQVQLTLGRNMYGDSRFTSPQQDRRGWLVKQEIAGGGVLMSSSVHFFSVASYILSDTLALFLTANIRQSHPQSHAGIEDDVDIRIRWKDGTEYRHRESWAADIPYRATIVGDAGQLEISGDDYLRLSMRGSFAGKLTPRQQSMLNAHSAAPLDSMADVEQQLFCDLWRDTVSTALTANRPTTLPDFRHARNMQSIIAAAYRSAESGQSCAVDWAVEKTRGTES